MTLYRLYLHHFLAFSAAGTFFWTTLYDWMLIESTISPISSVQGVPKKKTIRFWHCFIPWLNCLTWYLIKWFVKYSIWEFQPWVRFFPLTSIAKTVAIFPKHTFFSDLFFVNFMKIREIPWYTFSVIKSKILVIRRKVNPF